MTLRVGRTVVSETLDHGQHAFVWGLRRAAAGIYHPRLTAVGLNGLRAELALPPVKIEHGPKHRR